MFKVIKGETVVDKMYTLHGYVGDPVLGNDRYIQLSWHTKNPIINTRCAYSAGLVVCFTTKREAYDFITNYMSDPRRNVKYHINWKVIEYRPTGYKNRVFAEKKSKYGSYYVWERYM